MPGTTLMDENFGRGVVSRDVAHSSCMVEVDVCHHHGPKIVGFYPEGGKCVDDHRS